MNDVQPHVPEPCITVVVPTYMGEDRILTCLDDLAAQTLPSWMYEVVVVQNGPRTRTPDLVHAWAAAHPALRLRLLETEVASAQNARNMVLDGPTAEWVTFVDDDDRLQPRFLEALWDAALPGTVPFGRVAIVDERRPGLAEEKIWLNSIPRRFLGRQASNADLWPALNPAWAKLVERTTIGDVRFDPALTYADDTVFWMEVFALSGARITLTDFRDDSMYLWLQRAGSITRSSVDAWTMHVVQKLTAIAQLQEAAAASEDDQTADLCRNICMFFWTDVAAYVRRVPTDAHAVVRDITARDLRDVPWHQLLSGLGGTWVFLDPEDYAALNRMHEVDGFTHLVATRPAVDSERLHAQFGPILTDVTTLPDTDVSWRWVGQVAESLRAFLIEQPQAARQISSVRSDSASAFSHLLAALVRVLLPDIPWVAIVGGPSLRHNAHGTKPVLPDATFDVLTAALSAAAPGLSEVPDDLGGLAEIAIALLADRVVFENATYREAINERLRQSGLSSQAMTAVLHVGT